MEMAKKKPRGHNIGGSSKQKRRKEKKGKSQISAQEWIKQWFAHLVFHGVYFFYSIPSYFIYQNGLRVVFVSQRFRTLCINSSSVYTYDDKGELIFHAIVQSNQK